MANLVALRAAVCLLFAKNLRGWVDIRPPPPAVRGLKEGHLKGRCQPSFKWVPLPL